MEGLLISKTLDMQLFYFIQDYHPDFEQGITVCIGRDLGRESHNGLILITVVCDERGTW